MTGTAVDIVHVASCPEVAPEECATTDIPEHLHDQDILWFRLDPTLSVGLGQGVLLSLSLPLDLRDVSVQYLTLAGEPYDAPYGDIHHRTEVLLGPADATAMGKLSRAAGHFVVTGGLGSTLPLGKTEADPYAAGLAGDRHQHMQLGTGTFNPVASADLAYAQGRWGGLGFVFARVPLYANEHGYQAPVAVSGGLGPSYRPTTRLTLLLLAEGGWESVERWNGTAYAGKAFGAASAGVVASLGPALALQGQVRANLWEHTEHVAEEGEFRQPLTLSVGLSWTFGAEGGP